MLIWLVTRRKGSKESGPHFFACAKVGCSRISRPEGPGSEEQCPGTRPEHQSEHSKSERGERRKEEKERYASCMKAQLFKGRHASTMIFSWGTQHLFSHPSSVTTTLLSHPTKNRHSLPRRIAPSSHRPLYPSSLIGTLQQASLSSSPYAVNLHE